MDEQQFIATATQHCRDRNYDLALPILKQALVQFPDSEILLSLLASCYGEIKMYGEAKAIYASILKINPKNLLARHQFGLAFFSSGDYTAALEQWTPILEEPTDFITKYYAALACAQLGQLERATDLAEHSLKLVPANNALEVQIQELIVNLGKLSVE